METLCISKGIALQFSKISIRKTTIQRIKDSKVTEEVLAPKESHSKGQASDKDSGILVTSPRWHLTAGVKNEKGKINGNTLKREER